MKKGILFSFLFLCVSACVQKPLRTSPSLIERQIPKRLVAVYFDSLPESSFQEMPINGIQFTNAFVGHVPSTPEVSLSVMLTGLFPGKIPAAKQSLYTKLLGTHIVIGSKRRVEPLEKLIPKTALVSFYPPTDAEEISWTTQTFEKAIQSMPDWKTIFIRLPRPTSAKNIPVLGTLLRKLQDEDLAKETLFVVVADHGQAEEKSFHSLGELNKALETGMIAKYELDTMLQFWLKTPDRVKLAKVGNALRSAPGVAEIYAKQSAKNKSAHYVRVYRNPDLVEKEVQWAKNNYQAFAETVSSSDSADLLVFLKEGQHYSKNQLWGGAQEQVQRIPLFLASPNLPITEPKSEAPIRLVDLYPIISRIMSLPPSQATDGTSSAIDPLIHTEN